MTARTPSRFIAQHEQPPFPAGAIAPLAALVLGFAYFVFTSSNTVRCVTACMAMSFYGYAVFINKREKHRFNAIASCRGSESICTFAKSFNARQIDTWIIRAAHQELQRFLHCYVARFPVRASDTFHTDLRMDCDDVEDILRDIADRVGRSLDITENNPYYGKVETVSDLVLFINAQPRTSVR
jgi:hypothetical protein